jgi:general secretion pathway protein H
MPAISATGDHAAVRALQRDSQGFTLIELLVVLMIMVLIAASLPTALTRLLPSRRITVTADRLVTDLQWLQSESIRLRTPGQLTLLGNGYRMEVGQVVVRSAQIASTTQLNIHARGDGRDLDRLLMFPDGSAQPGRIAVTDSGRRAELEIGMLTGRISKLR